MTVTINKIINFITFTWLTGPIFDKELRVLFPISLPG